MPLGNMLSTGIDLVEIHRIRRSMKNPRFCKKILGPEEYMQLEKRGFPPQSVAVSFAAKEAFAKAMGTGVRGFQLQDVELLRNADGQPYFQLHHGALELAQKKNYKLSVSATHTRVYASVVVVAYMEGTE